MTCARSPGCGPYSLVMGRIPRLDVDVDVENGVIEVLGVIPDEGDINAA